MNLLDLMVKIGVDDQATDKIGNIASGIKGNLATAAKVGAASVAALGAAGTAAAGALASNVAEVAEYGDNIEKMAQKMGMSFEAYQEWDAVMQHNGTSMETMKASMKTLANAAETGNDAFQKIGLTQEQIASMSQEELFEATISGLQNVTDTTERTYLAGQLMGRGATELGALLNMSAEETQAMRDRVHELGGVMSDEAVKAAARFQDSMQDMKTAMSGLKRNMVAEFLPGAATVLDGLADIFSGDTGGGAALVSEGVKQIVEKLREAIPKIVETVNALAPILLQAIVEVVTAIAMELPNLVLSLVPAIIDLAPTILDAGIQMFMGLVTALTETGPGLIDKLVDTALQLVDVLIDNMPQMLEAAGILFMAIAQAIIQRLPDIVGKLGELVASLVQFVIEHAPEMLAAAMELILALAQGIIQSVGEVIGAIGQIGQAILEGIGGFFKSVYDAGANLIGGFIQGIVDNIAGVGQAIMDGLGSAVDGAKNFLGIASPSKVFAEIGENTMLGLEGGIEGELSGVQRIMNMVNDSLHAEGSYNLSGGVSGSSNGGSGIVINVTVESKDEDPYEMATLIGEAIAMQLRTQGVCA